MPAPWRPLFAVLLLALAVSGCDALGEPERFVNEDVRPPAAAVLDLDRVRPGRHVAGEVAFVVGLDSLGGRVENARVTLDGEVVEGAAVADASGLRVTVDTRRYAEGEHTLAVEVRLRDSALGLLGAVGAPDLTVSAPLVFDQRPPTPVAVASVAFEGGGARPRVTWTRNTDANFYTYLVVRQPLGSVYGPGFGEAVIDTVYDQAQTSVLAGPAPEVIGAVAHYEVRVWNGDREARSGALPGIYGPSPSDLRAEAGVAVASADGSRLYVHGAGGVVEVSAATLEPLRSLLIPGLGPPVRGVPSRNDLALDPETGRLYASTGGPFAVVDTGAFEEAGPLALPGGAGRFAVASGRVYSVDRSGTLTGVDAATGAVVDELPEAFGPDYSAVLGRSPDGRSLYVLDAVGPSAPAALVRVALGAEPRLAAWYPLPPLGVDGTSYEVGAAIAPDGRVVVLASQTVAVLDGETLAPGAQFTSERADPEVGSRAVAVRDGRVYAVFYGHVGETGQSAEVVELGLDDLRPLRTWPFAVPPQGLAFGAEGDLLAFTYWQTWPLAL